MLSKKKLELLCLRKSKVNMFVSQKNVNRILRGIVICRYIKELIIRMKNIDNAHFVKKNCVMGQALDGICLLFITKIKN